MTRMNRRKVLLGLGATAAGSGAVFGSGAFTQVAADRDLTLEIVDDTNAALKLEPQDSDYAEDVSGSPNGGTLAFDFGDGLPNADGINNRADSVFAEVFSITNNSDETIWLTAGFTEPDGTSIDPTSGGARSTELVAKDPTSDNVSGTYDDLSFSDSNSSLGGGPVDITYPGDEDKTSEQETSRVLGQTENAGAIKLGQGDSVVVDFNFLVFGSNDASSALDRDGRIVLNAQGPEAVDFDTAGDASGSGDGSDVEDHEFSAATGDEGSSEGTALDER